VRPHTGHVSLAQLKVVGDRAQAETAASLGGHVEARRGLRAHLPTSPTTLPQPALPEVPGRGCQGVAGTTARPNCCLGHIPCRLHPPRDPIATSHIRNQRFLFLTCCSKPPARDVIHHRGRPKHWAPPRAHRRAEHTWDQPTDQSIRKPYNRYPEVDSRPDGTALEWPATRLLLSVPECSHASSAVVLERRTPPLLLKCIAREKVRFASYQ